MRAFQRLIQWLREKLSRRKPTSRGALSEEEIEAIASRMKLDSERHRKR